MMFLDAFRREMPSMRSMQSMYLLIFPKVYLKIRLMRCKSWNTHFPQVYMQGNGSVAHTCQTISIFLGVYYRLSGKYDL